MYSTNTKIRKKGGSSSTMAEIAKRYQKSFPDTDVFTASLI